MLVCSNYCPCHTDLPKELNFALQALPMSPGAMGVNYTTLAAKFHWGVDIDVAKLTGPAITFVMVFWPCLFSDFDHYTSEQLNLQIL